MSVAEMGLTPMSVDKSGLANEYAQKIATIRSERDNFFEVTEYQQDIIKYLKTVEVNKVLFLNKNNIKHVNA
jgi:hypothetical protein